MPHNILPALIDKLQQYNPYHQWTITHNTATTPHSYGPLTLTHDTDKNTLTLTSYEPNDNNPNQDYPDVEITIVIDLLDPNFLQKLTQDYRLKTKE